MYLSWYFHVVVLCCFPVNLLVSGFLLNSPNDLLISSSTGVHWPDIFGMNPWNCLRLRTCTFLFLSNIHAGEEPHWP